MTFWDPVHFYFRSDSSIFTESGISSPIRWLMPKSLKFNYAYPITLKTASVSRTVKLYWFQSCQPYNALSEAQFFPCLLRSAPLPLSHPQLVFIRIDKIPLRLLLCRQSSPVSLSLFPDEGCSNKLLSYSSLWPFTGLSPVNWTLPTSLLFWGPQNWSQHSRCVSRALSRGEGSPPSTHWPWSSVSSPGCCWSSLP